MKPTIHPWAEDGWVITVDGEAVSLPMSLAQAQALRDQLRLQGTAYFGPWPECHQEVSR